jgi:hypothetical protein
MLFQIMRDFPAVGDWHELTEEEIEFFYDALRPELKEATRPK